MTDGQSLDAVAQHGAEPDRPWLTSQPGRVNKALIREWRKKADATVRLGGPDGEEDADDDRTDLAAGISVIVPSYCGRHRIGPCLRTLAEQTLDHELFEIIVILNGPPDGTRQVLEEFRQDHPSVTLRVVQLSASGASRAWNAGIAAAARRYTTFVDDDDYVSPSFLEVLLANAGPRTISIANIVDVGPNGHDADNYINRVLVQFAGKLTAPPAIRVATSSNAPKAVRTDLIKDISFPIDFQSGQDVVFWTTVVVKRQVDFFPCLPSDGAVYYRVLRDDSMSRQSMTFDFNVRQRLEVISKLDRLVQESDGQTKELVLDRMRAQTGFISRYLKEHPDDHGRVVELLDRYPIFHLPYEKMNGPRARGLAIAYAFPPYADTSAVVTAKRIRSRGDVVDVIYNSMGRMREIDESIRRISGPFVGQHAALSTATTFADWESMESFSVEGLKVIQRWEAAKGQYEWLYSRAQFAASHFLAASYKLVQPGATWIAEFSDPLSRDIHNRERGTRVKDGDFMAGLTAEMKSLGLPLPNSDNCFVWCEEIAYALADELLFTNESQLEYMISYCSSAALAAIARSKAIIAPQPTLPSEFYTMIDHEYPLADGLVHLAYFGNFYATRSIDDILIAIASADAWTRSRLRVHIFTSKPGEQLRRAAELGVSDSVLAAPYVRYLEFLNLTTKFDCLIVNDAVTTGSHLRNPYLPSKWADYKGSGTPVWGLIEAGSPLSGEPLAFVSPLGDADAASQVLSLVVRRKLGH